MTRRLTFDQIATTEDTDAPVVHAQFEDTGSFADIIIPRDEPEVRVWFVQSNHRGDMKRILDAVCEQLDRTRVMFLEPLDDLKDDGKLIDRLEGFEYIEFESEDHRGRKHKSTAYVGEWDVGA